MAPRKSSSSTDQATRPSRTRRNKPTGSSGTGADEQFIPAGLLETFQAVTGDLPYQPKSIFPSELFLFFALAKKHGCEHVIESGGRAGGSTTFLARLLHCPIESVADAETPEGVTRHQGDGIVLVPQLIRQSASENIAVLIDGPKDRPAVDLALEALKDPRVKFVAVHDLQPALSALGQFYSQDEAFRAEFGILDQNVGDYLEKYPAGPGLTIFSYVNTL